MSSSPALIPVSPGAANGVSSSQASGAPSSPCMGAASRRVSVERTTPIGSILKLILSVSHLSLGYRDKRLCRLAIVPAVNIRWGHSQSAEHALDLLAVLGRVVDDLKHHNPGLHEEPIRRLESSIRKIA